MSKVVETEKTGMLKSHSEMFGVKKSYPKNLCQDYQVRGIEEVVENGKVLKVSCVKTVHPQDNFSGFKAVEFALENVIAVGALDSLKECQLSGGSPLGIVDGVEPSIDNLINALNDAEAGSQNDGGNE